MVVGKNYRTKNQKDYSKKLYILILYIIKFVNLDIFYKNILFLYQSILFKILYSLSNNIFIIIKENLFNFILCEDGNHFVKKFIFINIRINCLIYL